MSTAIQVLARFYRGCLSHPGFILVPVIVLACVAALYLPRFSFDASTDTLVAEGDPDLAYYRGISEKFTKEEYLFLTYTTTTHSVFEQKMLDRLDALSEELQEVDGVKEVFSILDAPLFQNPPVSLLEAAKNVKTLRSADIDLARAEKELTSSPLFRELLISEDGRTTAIRISLEESPRLALLQQKRDALRSLESPTKEERQRLKEIEAEYRQERQRSLARRDRTLAEIRDIRDRLDEDVTAYLGGVPLIASDMITYIQRDITIFGLAVLLLTATMLYVIFRQWRWVVMPLACSALTILLTTGLLGFLHQPTTVISSNYISLIAIITISLTIHLIVRFRELKRDTPDLGHTELVFQTMTDKFAPCAYTALTTMVAFASLTTSEIVPVVAFGWIMCGGIAISFVVTYSFFPGLLLLLSKGTTFSPRKDAPVLTRNLAVLATRRTALLLAFAAVSCVVSVIGIRQVSLDNRFIDYFRSDTEVHRGLSYIDRFLGGTIPLDIILSFSPYTDKTGGTGNAFFADPEESYPQRYWFTNDKFAVLEQLHDYFDSKPEIGKVISALTLKRLGTQINNNEPLDTLQLMGALGALPEEVRKELLAPYASPEAGLLRLSARVHETGPVFSHRQLLDDIHVFIDTQLDMKKEDVRVTGMEVLFNSMLEHLFESQKSTIVFVVAATLLMFTILLRSLTLAVIGLLPNLMSAAAILAFMGFAGIPLDIMTITIAAIIIGIGVDDAIHYLHRFKQELTCEKDIKKAVINTHKSIGSALYYTSFTVVIGFSVMAFSSFIPTVYFGLLTSLAMIGALLANLLVLPGLIIFFCGPKFIASTVYRQRHRAKRQHADNPVNQKQ